MSFYQNPVFGLLAAAQPATPAVPFYQNPAFVTLAIIIGLIVASSLTGHWLAKILRAGDYGAKFGVILFAILASTVVLIRGWPPKLGIDLGGGSILVYQVDKTKTDWSPQKMDSLLASISKRINPGGQKEMSVRSLGGDMVQIVMPSVSGSTAKDKQAEADEIRKIIRTTGALEFRIVACNRDDALLIERAKAERKKWPAAKSPVIVYEKGEPKAKWCRIRAKEALKVLNDSTIRDAVVDAGKAPATDENGKIVTDENGKEVEEEVYDMLVLTPEIPETPDRKGNRDDVVTTGADIRDAQAGFDENGNPEVRFSFNSNGATKFAKLTSAHLPSGDFKYHLAIVLDDKLETAPNIIGVISHEGRITGDFKQKEVDEIVGYINAGSLPAALDPTPVRDMQTEASLGLDTIHKSVWAMTIASIAVPLFMIFYYRFAGMVAVLVLGLNMLMLVAVMILIKAPFTLPALAGLALTVGMAVDNNVLLYERLREELAHGAALRMAIRNAFHRVGVVIIDANITHLIAAAVLWSVGTEQIKGFAVTFFLGAILSIWATMFVARILFDVAERRRWITRLSMMQWIGHTKIDFMAWFPACATFSVLITVLGIAIAGVRGKGLFDIDFTGGVSVQAVFQKAQDISKIRETVDAPDNKDDLPDATITPARSQDEPDNHRFIIDTSNGTKDLVETKLQTIFGDRLLRVDMKYVVAPQEKPPTGPAEITPPEKKAEKPAAPTAIKPLDKNGVKADEMPSDHPVDKSAPKPPGVNPAGTAPPAGKSSGAKPAEHEPKQSRSDLPSASLVAMAGPDAVLLALADPPAAKSTAEAKVEAKPDVKAGSKTSAAPEPKPGVKPEPKSGVKAEKPEPAKTPAPAATVDSKTMEPPALQVFEATLTLSSTVAQMKGENETDVEQPVKYDKDRLKKVIDQVLKESGIVADIELTSSDGSSRSETWNLKLRPSYSTGNPLTPASFQAVLAKVALEVRDLPYFPIVDNIGAAVASDTQKWAVIALVSSWSLIILYLWIRFQGVAFGLAAVIALIHDVLVMLGAIAFSSYLAQIPGLSMITLIEPFKINLPIVAAFLTIIGYSVNDTIVVFDRIREIRGKSPTLTRQMVNDATNQTLSRTVLTSFTVMMVVVILYIFGGEAVHGFAFALIIGVLTGTYSSIYVAAPILLWLLHPKEMTANSR